ncbi:IS3 family transposase [Nitrospira sp. Kam-Ns4a]
MPTAVPNPSDEALLARIRPISQAHPFWGYRRVWAWLRDREGLLVNTKRGYRLMREAGWTVKRARHAATRTPKAKPKATRPRQFWGIDMTKFLIPALGWAYLVVVLDWYTKKIVGWDLALRSRRQEWEAALAQAVQAEFPNGVRGAGLKLVSDNGSQPTATGFMAAMSLLGIEQVFTSDDNPKGNAETERLMRTIKEELLWLQEFTSLAQAREAIGHWITVEYNERDVHSSLGDQSPLESKRRSASRERHKRLRKMTHSQHQKKCLDKRGALQMAAEPGRYIAGFASG